MNVRKKPNRTKSRMEIYIPENDKILIKKKAKDLGYSSVSSFLLDSYKSFFLLDIDMSVYRKLTREINYIGKNINSIIRRINTEKIFSDLDIEHLERRLDEIYDLINDEYKRLNKLVFDFTSDDLAKDDVEKIIKEFENKSMEVPKYLLLENVYQKIHDSMVFITEMISESEHQDEAVEEYIWNYLYGKTLKSLDENKLTKFSNELYKYFEILKIKKINLEYQFTDDDWFELLDILDKYEVS